MELLPQSPRTSHPLTAKNGSVRSCPHCREGGKVIIGKYITLSIGWDAENGCWHCVICGFIGFGTDFELLQFPLVACVGHTPRLPGEPKKRKIKSRL